MTPQARRRGRDPHEAHRVSTPLELLFDLSFVVAISLASAQLHHGEAAHHWQAVPEYLAAFFAIWWAWMNYTWYASAYDNDDLSFRLLTMAQMFGVLVFAVGIPGFFSGDLWAATFGYALMRLALVAQWLLAARDDSQRRGTCLRYAVGIIVVQMLWIARLALPPAWFWPGFLTLVVLELLVPWWAERAGATPWHPHHIAERYALMVIIGLGECVLGAANEVTNAWSAGGGWTFDLGLVGLGSMLLVLTLWWLYSLLPSGEALHHRRESAFGWGYGHYLVFAAVAAVGSGLEVVADTLKPAAPTADGAAHAASPLLAICAVALPLAVVVVAIALLQRHTQQARSGWSLVVLGCLFCIGVVPGAVAIGLPLPWALVALSLGPVIAIVAQQRGRSADAGLSADAAPG